MLQIAQSYIDRVRAAGAPEELHELVNDAIRLEHATIPAYLSAYFSLMPGTNQAVGDIIRGIVIEEMLHMSIASNLLIAIGGSPKIDDPAFIPAYPGTLPMNVGHGVVVGLEPCSGRLIQTFMQIEEPEKPLVLKAAFGAPEPIPTIGAFYQELLKKLEALGPSAFIGDFDRELFGTRWFTAALQPITDFQSAKSAVEIIVVQGEGTAQSPTDDTDGDLAHYYLFSQIAEGRLLVQAPNGKWSYSGAPISIDSNGVYPMAKNARSADYPEGTRARQVVDVFNMTYSNLLRALHRTFNGEKAQIDTAMGLMFDLRFAAQDVLQTPNPAGPGVCGLPFEFVAV